MTNPYELITSCIGFQWDKGNLLKNWEKHGVSAMECEQLFFNEPLLASSSVKENQAEPRYYVLGQTDNDRYLFVVFTVRENYIRIISARDMSRKERGVYGKV